MEVAAIQDADQHIRSSLGFSILYKDTSACRPGELNQRSSDYKMLALPLTHSHPCQNILILGLSLFSLMIACTQAAWSPQVSVEPADLRYPS